MNINFYKTGLFFSLASLILLAGCSDDFLKEKKNYGSVSDYIYDNYEGARGRVNYLYNRYLPKTTDGYYFNDSFWISGNDDAFSSSTEEYNGFSKYVDPALAKLTTETVDEYYHGEYKISAPWGGIRNCNDIIAGLEGSSLTQDQKEELLAQAYFFRAWAYWRIVRFYGGIPIIDEVQAPVSGDEDDTALFVPRSTTKECMDFICSDLDKAAAWLPSSWFNSSTDYGRITKGAALALKARIRLYYASPLYNRSDDRERWRVAYEAAKEAYDELHAASQISDPGVNGSEWAKAFATIYPNPEAVFFTLHNNLAIDNYTLNNTWENNIRPGNIGGNGGRAATAMMVDLFPMADGKRPQTLEYDKLEESTTYAYNPQIFFANRDPRFYRTFAFPGVKWAAQGANLSDVEKYPLDNYPYPNGENYEFWGYAWHKDAESRDSETSRGFYADGIENGGRKSVMIRKRSNDTDVSSALYNFSDNDGFKHSAAPYLEIRYAEVLLNYAEAACGYDRLGEAVAALQEVRSRVGYTAANNYGLQDNLSSNRAACFAAILYERQIEFAYEGKRWDDMRRWLLWDGGEGHESISSTWKLTGFDGNTCTYLGVPPLNGKRRPLIEVTAQVTADENIASDPIKIYREENDLVDFIVPALNLKQDSVLESDMNDDFDLAEDGKPIDKLAWLYQNHLKRKNLDTEAREVLDATITFHPEYYIIGLSSSVQKNNKTLIQTVGWEDVRRGGMGTFDPLAE